MSISTRLYNLVTSVIHGIAGFQGLLQSTPASLHEHSMQLRQHTVEHSLLTPNKYKSNTTLACISTTCNWFGTQYKCIN